MSLVPTITIPIFQISLASHGCLGTGASQIATGCANGLQQYMSAGVTAITIDTGTAGAGKGTTVGIVLPTMNVSSITSFVAHLINGPFGPIVADAISTGISVSMAQAVINSINAGVGVGVGVLSLTPNGAGSAIFSEAFKAAGMNGSQTENFSNAISQALDFAVTTAVLLTGVIPIVGPPNIVPGVGVGSVTIT